MITLRSTSHVKALVDYIYGAPVTITDNRPWKKGINCKSFVEQFYLIDKQTKYRAARAAKYTPEAYNDCISIIVSKDSFVKNYGSLWPLKITPEIEYVFNRYHNELYYKTFSTYITMMTSLGLSTIKGSIVELGQSLGLILTERDIERIKKNFLRHPVQLEQASAFAQLTFPLQQMQLDLFLDFGHITERYYKILKRRLNASSRKKP